MKQRIKESSPLQLLFIIAMINTIVLIIVYGIQFAPDSSAYITSWSMIYSKGGISSGHPPVYPYILGILCCVKSLSYWPLIIFQFICYFISIKCFYLIGKTIIANPKILFCLTLFYTLCPCFSTWNLFVLTESLAMNFSVIYLYCMLRVGRDAKLTFSFLSALLLLLMIFLRPAFIYLIPIHLCICILLFFYQTTNKRIILCNVLMGVFVIVALVFYMNEHKKKYGLFAMSGVSVTNQYYMARQYGVLDINSIKNDSLKALVANSYKKLGRKIDSRTLLWKETHQVADQFDIVTINDAVNTSIINNPQKWIMGLIERVYYAVRHPLFKSPINFWGWLLNFVGPSINTLICFLLIYISVAVNYIIKRRYIPWFLLLCIMIVVSNIVVILIGAQDEYSRLLLPSLPIAVLLFGQSLDKFRMHYNRNVKSV